MNSTPGFPAFNGTSLTDIIIAGLAGVKLATLKHAPAGVDPRPDDMPALGMADDTVKRYYFYSRQLVDELRGLKGKATDLQMQIFGDGPPRYFGEFMIGLCDGSKLQQAKQLENLHAEIGDKLLIFNQVTDMFWVEAKRRNPKLQAWQKVTLHADWSFSGSDSGKMMFDLSDIFGGLDSEGGDITSLIERILGGARSHRRHDADHIDRAAA